MEENKGLVKINEQEIHDVILANEITGDLVSYMPEHKNMIKTIIENVPKLQRATSFFGKSQSQFMNNMLTVSHPTPIRNLRQILSEMQTTKQAIQEAYFKNSKKIVEIKQMKRDFNINKDGSVADDIDKELKTIEIHEAEAQLESSKLYLSGAIRKMTGYIDQYNSIMKEQGITDFNEYDFEAEEERYHIMKAFEQAITSARPRGGTVDEGNQIYFAQIGINGATAQAYIRNYLLEEDKILARSEEPPHEMFLKFLKDMADKFQGSAEKYAKYKGMTGKISESAVLLKGDERLLLEDKKKEETVETPVKAEGCGCAL